MMHKDGFVVAVKVDGRILRERDGRTVLPFGSEYSLYLKNLESNKASVKVSIDGKDVLNGKSLILAPNSSMELERFVEDSLERGNRFRFIQKTQEIVDHRGDRIDDGIIRVEFAFEQVNRYDHVHHIHHIDYHYDNYWYWPHYRPYPWYGSGGYTWTAGETFTANHTSGSVQCCASSLGDQGKINLNADEGITVKGSESNQHFQQGYIGALDPAQVIIIRLSGEMPSGKVAEKPVFVKDKRICGTCGRKAESDMKFCGNCGTAF